MSNIEPEHHVVPEPYYEPEHHMWYQRNQSHITIHTTTNNPNTNTCHQSNPTLRMDTMYGIYTWPNQNT
jgi:hypothetical protein